MGYLGIFFRAVSTKQENKFGCLLRTISKIKRGPTRKTLSPDKYRKSHLPPRQCLTARINSDQKEFIGTGGDVLRHSYYSADFDSLFFHLFRSMENSVKNLSFGNDEEVKSHLKKFFSYKHASFYKNGIIKLT